MVWFVVFFVFGFIVHILAVLDGSISDLKRVPLWALWSISDLNRSPLRALFGALRIILIGLRSPINAGEAMRAVSPCSTSDGAINTFAGEVSINWAGGRRSELKHLSTRPLMRSSLPDGQPFGLQSFNTVWIGIVFGRNAENSSLWS